MRCNLEWLQHWLPVPVDAELVAECLTMAGLEIDTSSSVSHAVSGVLVGRVVSVEQHPAAARLKLCKVDIGEQRLPEVVCGADNVRIAMLTAYAPPGASIDKFKIFSKEVRGCRSDGMLCSAYELGMAEIQEGLLELDDDAEAGQELKDYLKLDDRVYDIDITPNRADCLSILGIAREIAAINRLSIEVHRQQQAPPVTYHNSVPNVNLLHPAACPRYLAKEIRVQKPNKATPLWMKERLRRCGIRSVCAVVDILNYVMLELGQPMHAFDRKAIAGTLYIRESAPSERLRVLGGQNIVLDRPTLLIADERQVLAIAGIIGGESSAVTEKSAEIVIESAFFQPEAVAGQARHYGVQTESSYRFERGVDFNLQSEALDYASRLIAELLGGEVGPTVVVEAREYLPRREPIFLHKECASTYLGVDIGPEFIAETLPRLGCECKTAAVGWQCTPPSYRFDLAIEEDLVEELARIYGYNRIPETVGKHADYFAPDETIQQPHRDWSGYLNARGYFEVITYSFISPEQLLVFTPDADIQALRLENPISADMSVMRTSLWPGLLNVLQYNLNRQQDRVCIFEQGDLFCTSESKIAQRKALSGLLCGTVMPDQWSDEKRFYDFYDLKGDLENLLHPFEKELIFKASDHPGLHSSQCADIYIKEKRVGCIGALSPSLATQYKLSAPVFLFELWSDEIAEVHPPSYQAICAYPSVRRDLSFVIAKTVDAIDILGYIDTLEIRYLADRFIFDAFVDQNLGVDYKSIGIGLIFQDPEKTLKKSRVDTLIQTLNDAISKRFAAVLRQ